MTPALDPILAERLAGTAMAGIRREYPNHVTHWFNGPDDARPPHELHPAFFGCLDWHSAVHNHWLLARVLARFPRADFAAEARALLEAQLTPQNIAAERDYLAAPGRGGFERPYGWAWLLALDVELAPWPRLRKALSPLAALIAERVGPWLASLPYPVRAGEHSNTAFALGLMLDWARATGHVEIEQAITAAGERFYKGDERAPLAYEPSGHDFISPALAEADLMARVLEPGAFADWLTAFLPGIPPSGGPWLAPATMPESEDYKLAHLPGVNLSRGWMLAAIAERLPGHDARRTALQVAAAEHARAGLGAALREDYGASHWLPTFAVYLLTRPPAGKP